MKFNEYYIVNDEGKSNCVIRSFCKLFNDNYENVFKELYDIKEELDCDSYNDIEVFETYLKRHNAEPIEYGKDIKINELCLDNGSYAIFCWDKAEFYHMVPVIDNTLYDKSDQSLELYAITIYKKDRSIL